MQVFRKLWRRGPATEHSLLPSICSMYARVPGIESLRIVAEGGARVAAAVGVWFGSDGAASLLASQALQTVPACVPHNAGRCVGDDVAAAAGVLALVR